MKLDDSRSLILKLLKYSKQLEFRALEADCVRANAACVHRSPVVLNKYPKSCRCLGGKGLNSGTPILYKQFSARPDVQQSIAQQIREVVALHVVTFFDMYQKWVTYMHALALDWFALDCVHSGSLPAPTTGYLIHLQFTCKIFVSLHFSDWWCRPSNVTDVSHLFALWLSHFLSTLTENTGA